MRLMFVLMFAAIATLAMTAFSGNVNAAVFVVNTTADTQDASPGNGTCADSGGQCSLRAAITEANALGGADTITLPAGTYTQTLAGANEDANAGGDFDITSIITINGAGSASTFVEAAATANTANERVFHVLGGGTAVTFDGLTMRNGVCRFATANGGGGIRIEGSTANVTISNSTVANNWSESRGGGIMVATQPAGLTLTNTVVEGNRAGSDVAGSEARGGGMDVFGVPVAPGSTVNITNSLFTNNTANSTVNNAFGAGMTCIQTNATCNVTNSTFSNNTSTTTAAGSLSFAGGIYEINGTLNVTDSIITGNASQDHAGIRIIASTIGPTVVNVTRSTLSNNNATDQGGGITLLTTAGFDGTLTIIDSTISGNQVTAADGQAAGVLNSASAGVAGNSVVDMTNSTVSTNTANDGGGLANSGDTAVLLMNFCTVSGNVANNVNDATGGGILQFGAGSTFLQNTIVANNVANTGPDIFTATGGTTASLDYNHVENLAGSGFTPLAHDVTGTDPAIGPLANNGGPTLTHMPDPGSPVIDTIPNGTNGCGSPTNTDQRGQPRPFPAGGSCDKGSVERGTGGGGTPTPSVSPSATPSSPSPTPATPTPTPATPTPTPATPTPTPATPTPTPATPTPTPATPTPSPSPSHTQHFLDFNGDGRTDYALTRAENGLKVWYVALNGTSQFLAPQWGIATDVEIPADYDGDHTADFAVFRDTADPDRANFYILRSSNATVQIEQFGRQGDDPKVVGDYDNDGRADVAVFRNGVTEPCGAGHPVFFWRPSGSPGVDFRYGCWGVDTDAPYVGDFDGDGQTDLGIVRRPGGQNTVYIRRSSDQGIEGIPFGTLGDTYLPCDYDGDGKNDLCLVRLVGSDAHFYVLTRTGGGTGASPIIFSNIVPETVDQLAFGDFDGDGTTDFGAFHAPSGGNGLFVIRRTADGGYIYFPWGSPGDHSVAENFAGGSGN